MDEVLSLHGWIILDKAPGQSSAQAVATIKRLARRGGHGKVKAGHGGTLDPLATGVLPIALGEATKLTGRLLDSEKAYRFEVTFGTATATEDAEGAVTATSDVRPARDALLAALPRFTGPIMQRPPAYSALKVDGERAYALARAGEAVDLPERAVEIYALELEATRGADAGLEAATLHVRCSKGTYVRSLARDIALSLGTLGHVSMLRRTRAGPFGEAQALTVDKVAQLCDGGLLGKCVLPLTAALDDIPALAVDNGQAAMLRQGRTLPAHPGLTGLCLALLGDLPVALVRADVDGVKVERGFNLSLDVAE